MVNYSVSETGITEQVLHMSAQTNLTLEDLHPFYTYTFIIAAVTIDQGPFSEMFSFQMPQAGEFDVPFTMSTVKNV